MRRPLIAIASLLAASLACAQGVYKWTDAQGTVHYSETPPTSGKYSRVEVSTDNSASTAPANAAGNAVSAPAPAPAGNQPSGSVPNTPQNRDQLCATLRTNLSALRGNAPVVTNGANGQPALLSSDQRKDQLDANTTQYNQFCGNHQ